MMLGTTTTSLIVFIFGVLVNIGKKVVCLQLGLKVDAAQEILTVVMMPYYKNVRLCKTHTVVCHVFCFW